MNNEMKGYFAISHCQSIAVCENCHMNKSLHYTLDAIYECVLLQVLNLQQVEL